MDNRALTYRVDATINPEWFGLFCEFKSSHLSIVIEDVDTDRVYTMGDLPEAMLAGMIAENEALVSIGLEARYRMKVSCKVTSKPIFDQILGVFNYIASITYES